MGKALPDKSKDAYSLFSALSNVHTSTLTCGFSICQVLEQLMVPPLIPAAPEQLRLRAKSSLLTIGSGALDTNSNSMVIGAYLMGNNFPQLNNPYNGLNDTVLD